MQTTTESLQCQQLEIHIHLVGTLILYHQLLLHYRFQNELYYIVLIQEHQRYPTMELLQEQQVLEIQQSPISEATSLKK